MAAGRKLESPIAARIYGIILAAIASYFGYEKVEEYRASEPAKVDSTVNVNIESVPDALASHSHGPVLSRDQVRGLIKEAIEANNKEIAVTYKQLESWERNQ